MTEEDIGTVRWFGESWGAPVCDPRAHVETPMDETCAWGSGAPIKPGDQGVGVPDGSTGLYVWYHLDCWMRVIGVEVTREAFDEPG